jgi:hypothetical protein
MYYKWLENTSKFIFDKKKYENFSILVSGVLWKLPPTSLTGMFKCQAPQLLFPIDFRTFIACFAIQNL